MVDWYGRWTPEKDYSTYPEEKWCDYDRLAAWIMESNYQIKTSMNNLCNMIFLYFDGVLEEEPGTEDNIDSWKEFVLNNGGLSEFDYEP